MIEKGSIIDSDAGAIVNPANSRGVMGGGVEKPSQKIRLENEKRALSAALKSADEAGLRSLAIPGLGTGTGRVAKDAAAKAMASVLKSFKPKSLMKIILMDKDGEMVRQWKRFLKEEKKL